MQDHLCALKQNGIYSNLFFLSLRYPYKIGEVMMTKIRRAFTTAGHK